MDYLILGLLILSPMSGYELQQFIRQNLVLICSHSAGSIQTSLTKLCKADLIRWEESSQGNRKKKTHHITDAGRGVFDDWVSKPMQADKVKNMELSRLFFLGLAKPEARIAAIGDYIRQIEEAKAVLSAIQVRFQDIQKESVSKNPELLQVLDFQKYTIEYGIAAAEFEISWYSRLLRELEDNIVSLS